MLLDVLASVAVGRTGKWLTVLVSVVGRAGNSCSSYWETLLLSVLVSVAVGRTGKCCCSSCW